MHAHSKLGYQQHPFASARPGTLYRLGSAGDPDPDSSDEALSGLGAAEHEDLPYRVELWNDGKAAVEQVLAITASGSIGYAAYYAATREYPNRYITLRHKNGIISRWNGPSH